MVENEHDERDALITDIRDIIQDIKGRSKRKTPPIQNLEESSSRIHFPDKNPVTALQPGILRYDTSPRELDEWIESFNA